MWTRLCAKGNAVRSYAQWVTDAQQGRPSHGEVVAAVARDAEITPWVADPDGYVLVPVPFERAEQHDFFALTPLTASHPVAVLLARRRVGGELMMTSGRPDGVWRVLRGEPELVEPDTIVQLLGRPWDTTRYIGPGTEPPIVAEDHGWLCDLRVSDIFGSDRQRWRLALTEHPSWLVE